jgi:hypothetical protein
VDEALGAHPPFAAVNVIHAVRGIYKEAHRAILSYASINVGLLEAAHSWGQFSADN